MVREARYFEDANGTPHKTDHEAWKSDLIIWLIATGAVNEANARGLVNHITEGGRQRASELAEMLHIFAGTMPALPVEAQS